MHDELTQVDIDKIKAEIEERKAMMPELRAEVKRTREFGDLSENDEYRSAKRDFNKNRSRISYLEKLLETAVVITAESADDEVGLFDKVTIYYPEEGEEEEVRIVTTLRNDVLINCISKESPFGKALLGHKVGETVTVRVDSNYSYPVEIRAIEKQGDDENLPISTY